MFDDLTGDDMREARDLIAGAGIEQARLLAATRLSAGPASGMGDPKRLVDLLMARDVEDPRWERLGPFELRWSLLVLKMLDGVAKDPAAAVLDARKRGATWAVIAQALGVKTPSAHARFRAIDPAT